MFAAFPTYPVDRAFDGVASARSTSCSAHEPVSPVDLAGRQRHIHHASLTGPAFVIDASIEDAPHAVEPPRGPVRRRRARFELHLHVGDGSTDRLELAD